MTEPLRIPQLALVALIGPSGCGKTTFAKKHFLSTEVLSSDACRGLVSDDENDQAATKDAFDVLHFVARKRLAAGRLTVVDATNVRPEDRKPLVALAREYHCIPTAIVFDLDRDLCIERNEQRENRRFGARVVVQQLSQMRRSLRGLQREGFRHIHRLTSVEQVDSATIERTKLYSDRRDERGPFDIIGDVHGCTDELEELLTSLGYSVVRRGDGVGLDGGPVYAHPERRKAVFLGDIGDRGPRILDCFRIVRGMVAEGAALCVPGNHDMKLYSYLRGKSVQIKHGMSRTVEELYALPSDAAAQFRSDLAEFIYSLVSHYVLDEGRLVVAHAGMKESMQGRGSGKVRDFALYGETTGETDEFGLPVRHPWAAEYRGNATVVYGHTPVLTPEWLNRTINIDTGCVFGGRLTALKYPELELISVAALRTYYESAKSLGYAPSAPVLSAQQSNDDLLDISDVFGKRIISTRLQRSITIRQENATAALEVMSRFAVNPKWLIYLPPTMSPCETSRLDGFLEHPVQAFDYFRREGIDRVICQEKHMGSRAVIVLCRNPGVARERFGITGDESGICYTRTGRAFFQDSRLQAEFLGRVGRAMTEAGLWEELQSDWVVLDCELMPWSLKAQELLRTQYAAVGAAARTALPEALAVLQAASDRGADADKLLRRYQAKADCAERFVQSYRRYCWEVSSISDLKLAPFHFLASEGRVHVDRDHSWHVSLAERLSCADPEIVVTTPNIVVETGVETSVQRAMEWWRERTDAGGEGMVVKPMSFIARGRKGPAQPALKVRGREYLRIIYGPEYSFDEHLIRLRERSLSGKRALAIREFALGVEGLERFVAKEPLRRVHECVFGVLAMESEAVDPRL